jgi:MFS family permease
MLAVTIGLLAIFGLAGGVCTPAWMDIVARVTPLRMRGKLFGWSGATSGLLGVAGGLLAERVLARYAFPLNFALCFLAAGICMFISFAALAMLREPAAQEEVQRTSAADYVRNLPAILRRDRDFTAFIVSRVLTALGGMAVALVAIYAAEERGLPESLAGRFTAVMLGTQVVTTPLWGMIGDRRGHKWPLQFGLFCQALAMALVLVVSSHLGFYVVFSLIGASAGLLFTTTLNIVVEFAPAAERVTYLGLHGTLIAPATLVAPLLGGWLADRIGYTAAFGTAAVCGFIAFAILSWFVRDPRWRQLAAAERNATQSTSA